MVAQPLAGQVILGKPILWESERQRLVVRDGWTSVCKISSRASRTIKLLTTCSFPGLWLAVSYWTVRCWFFLFGDQPSVLIQWLSGSLPSPLVHCLQEGRTHVSHRNLYIISNRGVDRCPVPGVREESRLCGNIPTSSLCLYQLHQQCCVCLVFGFLSFLFF